MACLGQVVLQGHCGRELYVLASSMVKFQRHRISTDWRISIRDSLVGSTMILDSIGVRKYNRTPSTLFAVPTMSSFNLVGLDSYNMLKS